MYLCVCIIIIFFMSKVPRRPVHLLLRPTIRAAAHREAPGWIWPHRWADYLLDFRPSLLSWALLGSHKCMPTWEGPGILLFMLTCFWATSAIEVEWHVLLGVCAFLLQPMASPGPHMPSLWTKVHSSSKARRWLWESGILLTGSNYSSDILVLVQMTK